MNWRENQKKLIAGETIQVRPSGNSMAPRIGCGDLVTIIPAAEPLRKDEIVFCKVHGKFYIHLIQRVTEKMGGNRYQIGNNKNHTNGTIGIDHIFGKVTGIEGIDSCEVGKKEF